MAEPRRESPVRGEMSEIPALDMSGQSVVATGFKQVSCNDFEYGKAGVGRLQLD